MSGSSRVEEQARQGLVIFQVGPGDFALEVGAVRQVLPYRKPIAPSDASGLLEGHIEVRGTRLAVIDLRRTMSVPAGTSDTTRMVIARAGDSDVALVVDAVFNVAAAAAVRPAPRYLGAAAAKLIRGLVPGGDKFAVWVELEQLLTPGQRATLSGSAPGTAPR